MLLLLLAQQGLWFTQPEGEEWAGETTFELASSLSAEHIVGLELLVNGQAAGYAAEPPFLFRVDLRDFPDGEISVRADLTLYNGRVLSAVRKGVNHQHYYSEKVAYVRLPVRVLPLAGQGLPQLAPADFVLLEEGSRRPIEHLHAQDQPLHVVILVDASGSMEGRLAFVKRGIDRFLHQLQLQDQVQILGFHAETFQVCPFTSDFDLVRRKLIPLRADGDTNLYGAIWTGLRALSTLRGRRVLLVFTDGHQEVSRRTEHFLAKTLEECTREAQSTGIPIYAMGVGAAVIPEVLRAMADETGGHAYLLKNRTGIVEAFSAIGAQLGQQLLLGYTTASQKTGWHRIELQTSLPGVQLHYPTVLYFH